MNHIDYLLLGIALFLHREDLFADALLECGVLLLQHLPGRHAVERGVELLFGGVLQALLIVVDPARHGGGQYGNNHNRFPGSLHRLASF
ncbi:hypothetical protein D3C85_1491130 [compost metagenome]